MLYIHLSGDKQWGNFGNNGNGLHIDFDSSKSWYANYKYHRLNGPAVKYADGDEEYLVDNDYHRDDGPAINYKFVQEWFYHGKQHRLDGPAIVYDNGDRYWLYMGKEIECNSQEEYERIVKLRAFW